MTHRTGTALIIGGLIAGALAAVAMLAVFAPLAFTARDAAVVATAPAATAYPTPTPWPTREDKSWPTPMPWPTPTPVHIPPTPWPNPPADLITFSNGSQARCSHILVLYYNYARDGIDVNSTLLMLVDVVDSGQSWGAEPTTFDEMSYALIQCDSR